MLYPVRFRGSGDLQRTCVGEQAPAGFIVDEHTLPHAVENGVYDVGALSQFGDGVFQSALGLPVPAFSLMQGKGGLDVPVQLPVVEGLQDIAERRGSPSPLKQAFPGVVRTVGKKYHRNVEPASDPLRRFEAVGAAFGTEIDQGQIGLRPGGFFNGARGAAGTVAHHRIPQASQPFLEVCRVPDNQ